MARTEDKVRGRTAAGAGALDGSGPLALTKHEAAGNDFLVLVDLTGCWDLGPDEARWLCDRRLGVGADGVLVAGRPGRGDPPGTALTMVLTNADGSRAEMSGNGIRCLVQAAVRAGAVAPGTVRVATDAGVRSVRLVPGARDGDASASVGMGHVRLGREVASPVPGTHARLADVGNPHLVVVGNVALETLDLASVHREATELVGEQVNVELVWATGPGALALRVFERGVGETAACGTGSCAAASVARGLGMVGDATGGVVLVANPGGVLEVRLPQSDVGGSSGDVGSSSGDVVLAGPVRYVAEVLVDPWRLEAAGAR